MVRGWVNCLCAPYDVIDQAARSTLMAQDPDNVVRIVLPEPRVRLDRRWLHEPDWLL